MPLRPHAGKMRPGNSQIGEKPELIVLIEGAKSLDLPGCRFASSLRTCPDGYLSAPAPGQSASRSASFRAVRLNTGRFGLRQKGLARAWLDAAPPDLTGCCGLAAAETHGFEPRKASHLAYPVATKRKGIAWCGLVPSLATTGTKKAAECACWCRSVPEEQKEFS